MHFEEDHNLNTQQSLQRLNELNLQMSSSQSGHQNFLRSYINIYVHKHSLSQDFFSALCEHSILQRLFTPSKQIPSLAVLEMFNLMISNTTKFSTLIYYFSQPIVHTFLFNTFDIFKEDSETIEYYIQMLKTIIMKMLNGNDSLLKMFCNCRFPSFPLLTVITILGTDRNHQELVRVTSHQCILLLINLMNDKQIGTSYLNQLQMVVFYYEFVSRLVADKEHDDQEGSLRYLVDLIFALRNNGISLSILMNVVVNVAIMRNFNHTYKIIQFLAKIRVKLDQYLNFPSELKEQIMRNLYAITYRFIGQKQVNYTYISALKIIPILNIRPYSNLIIFFENRCNKIKDYLLDESFKQDYEKQKQFVYQEWRHINERTYDISPLKGMKPKPRNSFTQFFTTKNDITEQYIKDVMTIAGLDFTKLKNPIFKLSWSANYQTALYLIQQVIFKYDSKYKQIQFFQNLIREQIWQDANINLMLLQILKLVNLLKCKNIAVRKKDSTLITTQYQGEYEFLMQIKQILSQYLFSRLVEIQNIPTLFQTCLYFKLINDLSLKDFLITQQIENILASMQTLIKIIADQVLDQQKFRHICRYVLKNKQKTYLRQNPEQISTQIKTKSKIQVKLLLFQVMKRTLNSSLKNLNNILQQFWQHNFIINKATQTKFKPMIVTFDQNGNKIEVTPTEKYELIVKISNEPITFSIGPDSYETDPIDPQLIKFTQINKNIRLPSRQKAFNFINDVESLIQHKKEVIRSAILQYLSFTYQTLMMNVNEKQNINTPF